MKKLPVPQTRTKRIQRVTNSRGDTYEIGIGGPPAFVPTKADHERVKRLVLLGLPDELIASCMRDTGISVDTLRKYFMPTLTQHKNEVLGKIAAGAFRMALPEEDGGYPDKRIPPELRSRMMIFVLKTRGGWKENDQTVINAQNVQIVKRIIGVDEADV